MSGGAVELTDICSRGCSSCWRTKMLTSSASLRPFEEARQCQLFLTTLRDEVICLKWHHWFKQSV